MKQQTLQEDKLRELGAVMAFYHGESSDGDRHHCADNDITRKGEVTDNFPALASCTHRAESTPADLREYAVTQLKLDGPLTSREP
ncbi:hypothetical protein [Paraburkholderia dinghuensis]|uniref:Uncharacterized protein n=1 Tax=Paraburkholderia dinghuensis TaxID=2305225 RepID=A0A3N6MME6_9BURK|nr:hypothetical protein [Paraburkholderia dinghuensis]RQH05014.1 hypothetical protein D1Y85_16540 [Paraburkholderia dinghuensis]